jgi:hypothetical protein
MQRNVCEIAGVRLVRRQSYGRYLLHSSRVGPGWAGLPGSPKTDVSRHRGGLVELGRALHRRCHRSFCTVVEGVALVRALGRAGKQQGSEGDPKLARPMQTISVVRLRVFQLQLGGAGAGRLSQQDECTGTVAFPAASSLVDPRMRYVHSTVGTQRKLRVCALAWWRQDLGSATRLAKTLCSRPAL